MKYRIPNYDPKLSPERNAEIAEWAQKNFEAMGVSKSDEIVESKHPDMYDDDFTFSGEDDFDEDAVTDE
jgi:hypothetical protein